MLDLERLAATDEEVARLTASARKERVYELMSESFDLLNLAIDQHVRADGKQLAGVVILFSGGNDSTVLAHLLRFQATHAAHANTGVGIEQTRDFVRNVCEDWGLPLIEHRAPRVEDHYRTLVLEQGFPGPGHHYKMFQRLKERALRTIRNEIIDGRRSTHRVIFLAGRRRQESARRANVPEFEREGTTVWVSPMVNWTKLDLNFYRAMHAGAPNRDSVPINEVSDLIHMSGECLCGAFAKKDERAQISQWFPEAFEEIAELEALIADREDIAPYKRVWGWGWNEDDLKASRTKKSKVGRLCSSCDARHEAEEHVA